jgi:hypothetical protein
VEKASASADIVITVWARHGLLAASQKKLLYPKSFGKNASGGEISRREANN